MTILNGIRSRGFEKEFHFKSSRSGGPGGQNVNKVNTKVELRFNISNSNFLSEEEKQILIEVLAKKINQEGELLIISQSERTQTKNKEICIEKFYRVISKALTTSKERIPTKPTEASVDKRILEKRLISEKKGLRKKLT